MRHHVTIAYSTTAQLFFRDQRSVSQVLVNEIKKIRQVHRSVDDQDPSTDLADKIALRLTGLLSSQVNSSLACQVLTDGNEDSRTIARIYVKGADDLGPVSFQQMH